MRKTGKAAPKPLTTHQKQIVQKLIDAHGEDVSVSATDRERERGRPLFSCVAALFDTTSPRTHQVCSSPTPTARLTTPKHHTTTPKSPPLSKQAWFRDIKLNRMQHSEGKLREMLESFRHHARTSRHDFRAPRKPPTKIF